MLSITARATSPFPEKTSSARTTFVSPRKSALDTTWMSGWISRGADRFEMDGKRSHRGLDRVVAHRPHDVDSFHGKKIADMEMEPCPKHEQQHSDVRQLARQVPVGDETVCMSVSGPV